MKTQHSEFRALIEQAQWNLQAMLSQLSNGDEPGEEVLSVRASILVKITAFRDDPKVWEEEFALVSHLLELEQRWVHELKRLRENTSQELERLRAHRYGVSRYVSA